MERLNKYIDLLKDKVGQCLADCEGCCILRSEEGKCECREANIICFLEQLKTYKNLEEQGRLLILPCVIGTTVYNTKWWDDIEEKVKVNGKTFYRTTHKHKVSKSKFSFSDIDDFGKTVFLTREEAEAALEKMKGEWYGKILSIGNV